MKTIDELRGELQAAQWKVDGLEEDIDAAERRIYRLQLMRNDAVNKRNQAYEAWDAAHHTNPNAG